MNTPITVKSQAMKQPKKGFELTQKHKLALAYLSVAVLPFVLAQLLGMEFTGLYTSVLSAVNLLAMMVFFIQFPLAGRLKKVPLFSNIDWGITQHKKLGKYLGSVDLCCTHFIQQYIGSHIIVNASDTILA
ncbi:hypothetical protein K8B83_12240 [Shewanella inventionis]|uniref:hypothetical protein n=1 Tax=Shewanella inventionis TaxID=1738770 RepID=UPI001CBE52AA|nr:hypothetical protein [Shewanella inventionis]UAL41673.1 hypothetical protein K8B83_12240 [Shewanella inventionis]